jgi:uncharacterized protein with gpF-like domain
VAEKKYYSPDDPSPEAQAAREKAMTWWRQIAEQGKQRQRRQLRQALLGPQKAKELEEFLRNHHSQK